LERIMKKIVPLILLTGVICAPTAVSIDTANFPVDTNFSIVTLPDSQSIFNGIWGYDGDPTPLGEIHGILSPTIFIGNITSFYWPMEGDFVLHSFDGTEYWGNLWLEVSGFTKPLRLRMVLQIDGSYVTGSWYCGGQYGWLYGWLT
jgi:hypothetical protein